MTVLEGNEVLCFFSKSIYLVYLFEKKNVPMIFGLVTSLPKERKTTFSRGSAFMGQKVRVKDQSLLIRRRNTEKRKPHLEGNATQWKGMSFVVRKICIQILTLPYVNIFFLNEF